MDAEGWGRLSAEWLILIFAIGSAIMLALNIKNGDDSIFGLVVCAICLLLSVVAVYAILRRWWREE